MQGGCALGPGEGEGGEAAGGRLVPTASPTVAGGLSVGTVPLRVSAFLALSLLMPVFLPSGSGLGSLFLQTLGKV